MNAYYSYHNYQISQVNKKKLKRKKSYPKIKEKQSYFVKL